MSDIAKLNVPICGREGDTMNPIVIPFFDENDVRININSWTFKISVQNSQCQEVKLYDMTNGLSIVDNALVWSFGAVLDVPSGNNKFYLKSYSTEYGEQTMVMGDFIVQPLKCQGWPINVAKLSAPEEYPRSRFVFPAQLIGLGIHYLG